MYYDYPIWPIGVERACVVVKKIKNHYYEVVQSENSIGVIQSNALVTRLEFLDNKAKIYDANGNEIQPTGYFLITIETINPFHLIIDMF